MVSIVIQDNSLTDLVNAGLTVRHYAKRDINSKVYLESIEQKEQLWSNLEKYVDQKDRSLLILNFPLPSEETLEKIDLRPYEYSILSIPSELLTVTHKSKKILLEKGIVSMPQRNTYKCFPGEYVDQVEKKWMRISRIMSFEDKPGLINERDKQIIKGMLKTIRDPHLVIEKISEDDATFFSEAGEKVVPDTAKHIRKAGIEIVITSSKGCDLVQNAFYHFLECRTTPLGIKGMDESVILTMAPTFAYHMIRKCDIPTFGEVKSGKGAAIITKALDDVSMGILLGRISQRIVPIRFGKPKNVVEKTLKRRLIGGKGPKGRSYRGIKGRFPELEVKSRIIHAPRNAFENVIDVLRETGTAFEIKA